ncbi:hypothetical protein SLS56_001844 [Neofusicoccum ribis]|uniref:CorA-like transporter domain-containing protein n=1 Tax=Neofusicoccum ribis TaxID=45134 RepID=A0ABR3T6X0_9PEZI
MPAFLDFVFTFGRRETAQEFHFGGFRHELRLADSLKGPILSQLGRSGRDIRHCFNLRSVESSKRQQSWPWSIRQTAVYHCFDVTSGRATWIVIKGDKLMQNRIKDATEPFGQSSVTSFETNDRAFASSLFTHLIFVDWCAESWRWYIDFLEEEAQKSTGRTLSTNVETPVASTPIASSIMQPRSTVISGEGVGLISEKRTSTFSSFETPSLMKDKPSLDYYDKPRTPSTYSGGSTDLVIHLKRPPVPPSLHEERPTEKKPDFSFSDLQRVQFLEEKTNETILVIGLNISILADLKKLYEAMSISNEFPEELKVECRDDIERFSSRISIAENDLLSQKSRASSLLRMLADRRTLLFGILEYRNMEASRMFAEKAQLSANSMESMTRDMHQIAVKTKQETVSMRIITLVTLFFLPGTFISTLMSTDIIRWQSDGGNSLEKTVSTGALEFFMSITIPLMLVTFTCWYGVYWWVNKREEAVKTMDQRALEP